MHMGPGVFTLQCVEPEAGQDVFDPAVALKPNLVPLLVNNVLTIYTTNNYLFPLQPNYAYLLYVSAVKVLGRKQWCFLYIFQLEQLCYSFASFATSDFKLSIFPSQNLFMMYPFSRKSRSPSVTNWKPLRTRISDELV